MSLTVAGYQMAVTKDVETNTAKLLAAIERAAEAKADILLTPEGSLSGYTPHFDVDEVQAALDLVTEAAASQRLGLALGTCYVEDDGLCYNEVRFYESDGTYKGFHSKILRCGSHDAPPKGEINDYAATELRTFDVAGHYLGALICKRPLGESGVHPRARPPSDAATLENGCPGHLPRCLRWPKRRRRVQSRLAVSRIEPAHAIACGPNLDRHRRQR